MRWKPWKVHLLGVAVSIAVAVVILITLFPYLTRLAFPSGRRGGGGIRLEPLYYLTIALIPVATWLIPPFLRALARGTFAAHKKLVGKSGFYVRFPVKQQLRFRDTVLMSISPFAIDLLVITEIEYFLATPDILSLGRGFIAIPALLILAGFITALIPGPWLVEALGIRLVNPSKGEVVRAAAIVDGILGPIAAIALLASFITTLHQVNYSYEQGAVSLAEWAVRLFPPVLAAISIYRIVVEPMVLPSLRAWCEKAGMPVKASLAAALAEFRPKAAGAVPEAGDALAPRKSGGPPP